MVVQAGAFDFSQDTDMMRLVAFRQPSKDVELRLAQELADSVPLPAIQANRPHMRACLSQTPKDRLFWNTVCIAAVQGSNR